MSATTTPTYPIKLTVQQFVPVMLRQRQALILVTNPTHTTFTLGRKKAYPEGICRLVGGGIEPNEDPRVGAARELAEELSISVTPEKLTPLAQIDAEITSLHDNSTVSFLMYVYSITLTADQLTAADDLDELVSLDLASYSTLLDRYKSLPSQPTTQGFNWFDYGQLYGPVHAIALAEFQKSYDR